MKRIFSCSEVVIVGKTVDNVSVDPSSDFLAPLWYEEDHNQLCLPRTISQTTTVKPIQIPFNLPKKGGGFVGDKNGKLTIFGNTFELKRQQKLPKNGSFEFSRKNSNFHSKVVNSNYHFIKNQTKNSKNNTFFIKEKPQIKG